MNSTQPVCYICLERLTMDEIEEGIGTTIQVGFLIIYIHAKHIYAGERRMAIWFDRIALHQQTMDCNQGVGSWESIV